MSKSSWDSRLFVVRTPFPRERFSATGNCFLLSTPRHRGLQEAAQAFQPGMLKNGPGSAINICRILIGEDNTWTSTLLQHLTKGHRSRRLGKLHLRATSPLLITTRFIQGRGRYRSWTCLLISLVSLDPDSRELERRDGDPPSTENSNEKSNFSKVDWL